MERSLGRGRRRGLSPPSGVDYSALASAFPRARRSASSLLFPQHVAREAASTPPMAAALARDGAVPRRLRAARRAGARVRRCGAARAASRARLGARADTGRRRAPPGNVARGAEAVSREHGGGAADATSRPTGAASATTTPAVPLTRPPAASPTSPRGAHPGGSPSRPAARGGARTPARHQGARRRAPARSPIGGRHACRLRREARRRCWRRCRADGGATRARATGSRAALRRVRATTSRAAWLDAARCTGAPARPWRRGRPQMSRRRTAARRRPAIEVAAREGSDRFAAAVAFASRRARAPASPRSPCRVAERPAAAAERAPGPSTTTRTPPPPAARRRRRAPHAREGRLAHRLRAACGATEPRSARRCPRARRARPLGRAARVSNAPLDPPCAARARTAMSARRKAAIGAAASGGARGGGAYDDNDGDATRRRARATRTRHGRAAARAAPSLARRGSPVGPSLTEPRADRAVGAAAGSPRVGDGRCRRRSPPPPPAPFYRPVAERGASEASQPYRSLS